MSDPQHDLLYRPFTATPRAFGVYALLTLGFGAYAVWSTGEWLPWPPSSVFHVFSLVLPAALPLMLLQLGWSYALIEDQLVVFRFGAERYRVPLSGYQRTAVIAGCLRLHFQRRTVWLISGVDECRQAFLAELQRRAHSCGGKELELVRQLDGERLRIQIANLQFPHQCVTCGAEAERRVPLTVQRGFDVLLAARFEYVDVRVPACDAHAARRARAGWLSWLVLLPLSGLVACVLVATLPGGDWSGALGLGALGALVLSRPLHSMVGRQYLDWLTLGIRASDLSADLTEVTLRIRNSQIELEVLRAAKLAPAQPLP